MTLRCLSWVTAIAVLLVAPVASAQTSEVLALPSPSTHPDEGLMIAGGTVFLLGVTVGVAVLMPIELAGCVEPSDAGSLPPDHWGATCSQAPLSAIPFAHLMGGGIASIVAGPILLVAEIVGLFTFIGGAAHHHPDEAPQAGDVRLSGVAGADAGLSVTIDF
ncbi:hypothetical protein [Sandaracinus amylolyticus]|uniref:hypothetical protein n=1 Tax=Sandaracinus amylolyticus TaxID=927083 RepID=UPI001F338AFF|nr:hypothetical protein [Sandaracinus amylolyticus]UJR78563.1 Hypothetical protein I5071_5930 [Sandaracinus amylolyticus]